MDLLSRLLPWQASRSERSQLSGQAGPVLDPGAQDYAAWRSRSLRWACLAVAVTYAIVFYAGVGHASVKLGRANPTSLESRLEAGLNGYLRFLEVAFCLSLLAATWYWHRLRRSCALTRLAWALAFFGPMPLFLIPFPKVLHLHGAEALILASNVIRGSLTLYVPALFALLPALTRAALVLKRFLPESTLPGVLVVVSAPLQSLVYVLLISIIVQVVPHRNLILGVLFLALAPMVWLAGARSLINPIGEEKARRSLRIKALASRGLAWIGSALILHEVSEEIDLDWLLGQDVDLLWVLNFMAGVVASRTILSVILVDGLIAILFHADQAERAGVSAETADRLGRKIRSLGAALHDASPASTTSNA